jgi:transmembrane sensor
MDLSEREWERLERYVSGHGTSDELAELERWVSASAELRALADGMRTIGQGSAGQEPLWDEDAAWRRVSRRMRWFSRPRIAPTAARRSHVWLPWAVAACLMLAGGSSLYLVDFRDRTTAATAPAREVVTRRGERAAFNLADGSRVILGAESRLSIPAAYNRAARELHLEGQGYFLVTHDSLRPFRVNTSLGVAEDLGTEFVVTTYPEARGMRVVVTSGKVALRQPATVGRSSSADSLPLVIVSSGDLARLDSAGTATVSRVDPAPYVAWTGGALVFNGTPLGEVLPQLARWYDLDIHLANNSLASRRLTATFRDQSVSQVLDLIALSLDLAVERDGRTVTLRPSSPSRRS